MRTLKSVKWTSSMSSAFGISAQHNLMDCVCLCHPSLSIVMTSFSRHSKGMGMLTDSPIQVFQTSASKTAGSKLFWCTNSTINRNAFHLGYIFSFGRNWKSISRYFALLVRIDFQYPNINSNVKPGVDWISQRAPWQNNQPLQWWMIPVFDSHRKVRPVYGYGDFPAGAK